MDRWHCIRKNKPKDTTDQFFRSISNNKTEKVFKCEPIIFSTILLRFVKANNFARTKHKITFRVFDEYIIYMALPQTFKKNQYFKNIPNKYSLQKYSSLNSIRNPIIIEQIGKEIFPDEEKAIFSHWTYLL